MNSHLLNYRFSPDQSDIQYSPSPPCEHREALMDVRAAWLCMAPADPWDPTACPAAMLGHRHQHPPPPLRPSPCSPIPVSWKEWAQRERNSASSAGKEEGRTGWRDHPPSTSGILPAPARGWETEPVEPALPLQLFTAVLLAVLCRLVVHGHGIWSAVKVCQEYPALPQRAALSPCPFVSCCYFKWSLVSPPHLHLSPSSLFLMLVQQKI